ncbi:ERF family protein [Streptomyces wuyuanensis]|uniref:ERF superfamily protein n=1 Tax=Streptomyces wuyuanensis TaxID=1196353 RepID=A0A1G9VX00_9ACTN|nr:ERF family protein [Streptomyces wuyuanensis]SDM76447.1 ERF superfamily protein [Streptomyces wuyuanensis]
MTSLTERAEQHANGSTPEPEAGPAPTYTPAPLPDPGIPEPGPDGPEKVPVWVAWSRVMGEVRGIDKGDWYGRPGERGSYQFRGVDSALNAFGPACRLHGVLVLPVHVETAYRDVKTSGGKPSRECTVTVTYRIIGPTGDSIEVQSAGESMDNADKGTAKALSTSLRSLLFLGGLVPTNDTDPDATNIERGDEPAVRSAADYRDEIVDPRTSPGRLEQISYELRNARMLHVKVENEHGDEETLDALGMRHYTERTKGGASS